MGELQQTCEIALNYMNHAKNNHESNTTKYYCKDVAPAFDKDQYTLTQLATLLENPCNSLFQRYQTLFTLRNNGSAEAVKIMGNILIHETSSTLLKHEIAYVMGQLQHVDSLQYLEKSLRNKQEHAMVRHESAEALGALKEICANVTWILQDFLQDESDIVRESCEIILDECDYWKE